MMTKDSDTTVRTTVDVSRPPEDAVDWEAFDALTDEEVRAAASRDPDDPSLTAEELSRMRRVPDVREIRDSMGLSQAKLADRFDLPLAKLQDWEQGRRRLNRSTQTLMHIIEHEPDAVDRALRKAKGGRR
jgi:putative transcriptional regulator